VLQAGHRLVATARNPAQLAGLVQQHRDAVRAMALDVTDPIAAQAAVQTAIDAFGGLDVLVNMPRPPLRLPLGSDALAAIAKADQARLVELEQWRASSASTDFAA
jgi:NAD(P)-dependent dehydrogenase (short-subunit alcohol dehydrogenase family)